MPFLALPNELIAEIVMHVDADRRALPSLSLVSRRIHRVANSILYRRPIDLLPYRVPRNRRDSLLSSLRANDGGVKGRLVRSLDTIVARLSNRVDVPWYLDMITARPLLVDVEIPLKSSPQLLNSVCQNLAASASMTQHVSLRSLGADRRYRPMEVDAPAVLQLVTSTLSIDTLTSLSIAETGTAQVKTTAPLEPLERTLKNLLRLDVFAWTGDSSIQMLKMVRLTDVSGLRHIALDLLDVSDAEVNEIVSLLPSGPTGLSLLNTFRSDRVYPALPLEYFGTAPQLRRLDLQGFRAPFGSLLSILASSANQLELFCLKHVEWTRDARLASGAVADTVELAATLRRFPRLVTCELGALSKLVTTESLHD